MSEPVWIDLGEIIAIQGEQLARFGGPVGVRDAGGLQSALDRPRNKWAYGERALPALAASYAFGIVRNHPFVDGNKRTAWLAIYVFLGLNGVQLVADEAEATAMIEGLAAGAVAEEALAEWLAENIAPRTG